jgi:predicted AAA+ superfamily ATPase
VHSFALGALTAKELGYELALNRALSTGMLPGIYTAESGPDSQKTLTTYAATYLREEIQAEALTRNLEGFARFIQVSAEYSAKFLDIAKLAMSAAAARQSVTRWLEVLEDTLLVRRIPSFAKSVTRRLVQHPKLFYFDVGVLNGLLRNFEASADRLGALFEHLVAQQLFDSASAGDVAIRVSTFRTEHGAEVDFIVELDKTLWAIELKASRTVASHDLRGFRSFTEFYGKRHHPVVWYTGHHRRKVDGIDVVPWQQGLKDLGL